MEQRAEMGKREREALVQGMRASAGKFIRRRSNQNEENPDNGQNGHRREPEFSIPVHSRLLSIDCLDQSSVAWLVGTMAERDCAGNFQQGSSKVRIESIEGA
jgi:hypothetical protein